MMSSRAPAPVSAATRRLDEYFSQSEPRRFVRSVFFGMQDHHAVRAASAMAFDLFLASIPMMALAGWLFAAVLKSDIRAVGAVASLLDIAPSQVFTLAYRHIDRFGARAVAPIVLVGALWLASGAFHTTLSVFERAFAAERRPWWSKRLIAIGCVLAMFGALAMSASLTLLVAGGPVAFLSRLAGDTANHADEVGVITAATTVTLLVGGFFRVVVHRPGARRRVWPGTAVTMGIGVLASFGFAAFAKHIARYTVFYGSLAAVAIALIWLWICCAALLLGGEVNAQLEGIVREGPSRPTPSQR